MTLAALIRQADRRQKRLARPAATPPVGPRRKGWSSSSAFRGVYPVPSGRWAAKLRVGKTLHYCGTFDTEADAARAHDARATELLGDAARLNFPRAAAESPTRDR